MPTTLENSTQPEAATPPPQESACPPAPSYIDQHRRRWTRAEYYRLGELGFFEGLKSELIDGEFVAMSPKGWPHVLACGLLAEVLSGVLPKGHFLHQQNPLLVLGSEPEPDLAVVPGSLRDFKDHPNQAILIVEVAESSLAYDTGEKASLYAAAGVPDYWVLDLANRRLVVFRDPRPDTTQRFGHGYFQKTMYAETDSVSPLAVPSAMIPVASVLP